MRIFRHKNFTKQYRNLSSGKQTLIDETIVLFYKNPFDAKLRNHPLKDKYKGCNSIVAAFDLRIIFIQKGDYAVVVLLKVGSHNQLY